MSAYWWRHARWPLALFVTAITLLAVTSFDESLARAVFFDGTAVHWRGATAWWANELVHTGGRWLIRAIAALAMAGWITARCNVKFAHWRRPAGFLALAIILSTGLVGLLKSMTNVDCPVDLQEFGGDRPYVGLLADRPAVLPRARCFPAAHASSGYSLLALYFLWGERSRRRALAGVATGLGAGLLFGIAQQSRGAHFISHDVWSALLVWLTCLTLYSHGFRMRLHNT